MARRRTPADDLEKIGKEGFEMLEKLLQAHKVERKADQAAARVPKPKANPILPTPPKDFIITDKEAAKRTGGVQIVTFRPPKFKT